ncbi:MAG: rubredoxin [Clostridiales bacterium]|nr:rubredoxin [Clostridiales bacterium]
MKKLFKCSACGYVHEGEDAPDKCPKCGAPKEKFNQLDEEATNKVYTADRTNDIHMELINLATKIQKLAEEGIEINLDPPCVGVFNNAKDEAWVIKQRSKAELAGHVGKGKW